MAEESTRSLNMAGIWWMPDNYENRMMGTLKWVPNQGCLLTVVDESREFKWGKSPGTIFGLNRNQKPITLVGCSHGSGLNSMGSGNTVSFGHPVWADSALVGYHFANEADQSLTDLYVAYAGLDQYVMAQYYEIEDVVDSTGNYTFGPITFDFPTYEMAKIGETKVGLYVGWSILSGLKLNHKLHFSFPEGNHYRSDGLNLKLVHEVMPAFLSAMMGHQSFLTSSSSRIDNASVEVFDGYHPRMSWRGDPHLLDRLVLGNKERLDLWPVLLPSWVDNYRAVEKLCSAYIKIMSDGRDGFLEINNMVHIFFGLEVYHKVKCNRRRGKLADALDYTICRIRSCFENVEKYMRVVESIDTNNLSRVRQILVHGNEGNPDYALVYQQLIFITRCVLLMEMNYPVCAVENDTSHWELWHFFADRRKRKKANS